jgi:hypothetical protein
MFSFLQDRIYSYGGPGDNQNMETPIGNNSYCLISCKKYKQMFRYFREAGVWIKSVLLRSRGHRPGLSPLNPALSFHLNMALIKAL